MNNPPKKPKKGPTVVSQDDHALWSDWSQDLTPLKNRKNRQILKPSPAQPTPTSNGEPAKASVPRIESNPTRQAPAPVRADAEKPIPSLQTSLDQKTRRRLRSGRIEVSDSIDLHGMRQHIAHQALRGFLFSAQARGHRWVLVITGKGGPADLESRSRPWIENSTQERGVLRRNAPKWMAEPDLRNIVVSYTTAGPQHGGDGALYVRLRRRRDRPT